MNNRHQNMSSQSKSQLKILILTHNYIRFRGDHAGLFVHILAQGLVQSGHQVFVLAPHQKGFKTSEIMDGVTVHRFRYAPAGVERLAYIGNMHELVAKSWINKILFLSFLISFLLSALCLVIRKRFDLISAHWWIPGGLIGYPLSVLTRKPMIVTSHGTDIRILERSGFTSRLASLVYHRAKYVTTVSSFLKERLIHSLELEPEKVKVIPMPVTPEVFRPTPFRSEGTRLILCVARFTPQKGLDFFLQACQILKEKAIDFKAKIVGEGPLKNFLQEEIVNLNLEDRVFLLDTMPQEQLNLLYAESYLCVLPSVEEGFGLVLVEAQLCKRPVIGTRSGGILDIIEDGKSGILVTPKDQVNLASAMERIIKDENLAHQLAEEGYQSALAKFSPEAVLQKYLGVLV
jgi:glycosyltransferase involved in cell wall biosynthesis